MRNLIVEIEINGSNVHVGDIAREEHGGACFSYADDYLESPMGRAISISLPIEKRTFSAEETRNFFEGLLPEGFMRRSVAKWMRADEDDYVSILAGLGSECLGAIKILDDMAWRPGQSYVRLSDEDVSKLAREGATESVQLVTKAHLSLTGASGKVGLYYDAANDVWHLPMGEAPSTHIVKQSHVRLKKIVANEQLCLLAARKLGIETPESFIVNLGGSGDGEVLFATKRYDRKLGYGNRSVDGLPVPYRLHQEDFAQALGIPAALKYEKNDDGYMKKLFDVIRSCSSNPIEDQIRLWDICVYNYLVGNTDNHIKNLSLVYSEDLGHVRLAPAYDIISTMVYESSTEKMALGIGGLYDINRIDRLAFERQARIIGLGSAMAMKRFDEMVLKFRGALSEAGKELEAQGFVGIDEICRKILANGGISSQNHGE